MAELGNYNANPEELEQSFDPLPAGDYIAVIESSEWKSTKTGSGRYLNLKYQVIDGPFNGRKLFNILNLENPSQDAMNIARRTLNAICVATGVMQIQNSVQLHNIPMKIKVAFKEDAIYGPGNKITKHESVNGQTVQQQAPPVQQQPPVNTQYQAPAASQPAPQGTPPIQESGNPRPWEV